jgi:diacylglycerol diphosphate phosphatase/phosphatidate phosphatase
MRTIQFFPPYIQSTMHFGWYIADAFLIVALFSFALLIEKHLPQFHQEFYLLDSTIQYRYAAHERVSDLLLYVYSVVIPVGIITIVLFIEWLFSRRRNTSRERRGWDKMSREILVPSLALLAAVASSYALVSVFKKAIGKPRPDLIDRCQPRPGPLKGMLPQFRLANVTICGQLDKSVLDDGFASFPSGHSCTAFTGLTFLALYLAGKFQVGRYRAQCWRWIPVVLPIIGAALIAGTRIMDARHHASDVLFGGLLGVLIGWAAYGLYFPFPSEWGAKGQPYSAEEMDRGKSAPNSTSNSDDDGIALSDIEA